MGNTQPKNHVGKKATAQKLENAKKLGVLSLSEHGLEAIPNELFIDEGFRKLRTLDLSINKLSSLGRLSLLGELKSLNLDRNALHAGSLSEISKLAKLQSLSCGNNQLGVVATPQSSKGRGAAKSPPAPPAVDRDNVSLAYSVPPLPVSLRQLTLAHNHLVRVPNQVTSPTLVKVEMLDLSDNEIALIPPTISQLVGLEELRLDRNQISNLPDTMGELKKLKVLSLKNNKLTVRSTTFTANNPQPIPEVLFTETPLIDLNLHGNAMTNTQLNQFDGFQVFLERRQKVKSKTMTNLDVCGLD
ncbi:hypothetical protein ACA910_005814 [Epithemia clementina (nom. ined.)]